jgi:predicted TIM-barrel fold metal-dependent hydrolase
MSTSPVALGVDDLVDAHHHLWRRRDLPWLNGPMVPRIFGPYDAIRRDYLAGEYAAEAAAAGITASVYVQANWPLERSVEEVRWVQGVHEQHGWPHAIIGSADLFDERAGAVFAEQAALSPLVRGTRLQLHWHEDERYRFASAPDRMHDPVLRRNVGLLAGLGWVFELQVFPGQMADAAELVAALPDTTFVLVHAGMLESTAERHVAPWRAGLELLAAQPNVVVKLSGQGTFVHRVDRALIALVAATSLDLFGAQRCMFGTNFPIERLWTDLRSLVAAWLDVLAHLPLEPRRDVLARTARRVYRLAPRCGEPMSETAGR